MKPSPYDLLKAFLYAENQSNAPSWIPDETYMKIRDFVQSQEKITDSGLVWHSGRMIYEAIEQVAFSPISRDQWPNLSRKELENEVEFRKVILTRMGGTLYARIVDKEISDLLQLVDKKANEQRV